MTPNGIWSEVLKRAGEQIPGSTMRLWLLPLNPTAIEDGRLVIEASEQVFSWTSRRYAKLLGELVRAVSDLDGIDLRQEGGV